MIEKEGVRGGRVGASPRDGTVWGVVSICLVNNTGMYQAHLSGTG